MHPPLRYGTAIAALVGLAAVAAGAFGAHAAADPGAKELLRTGAQYQGLHALAAIVVFAALPGLGRMALAAGWLFVVGAVLFGGSLDLMAMGGPRVLGMITPLGGLAMMLGWLLLAVAALRRD